MTPVVATVTEAHPLPSLPPLPPLPSLPPHLLRVPSPIGRIELSSDGTAITGLSIETQGHLPREERAENGCPVLEAAAEQLAEYFAGTRREFDLPLFLAGTEFQRAVWAELQALPWGSTTSYGAIGIATGRPSAGRAVGGAVGANPVPLLVGCHRVLAGNRKITGYSAGEGIATKVWLLDHEGIPHA